MDVDMTARQYSTGILLKKLNNVAKKINLSAR